MANSLVEVKRLLVTDEVTNRFNQILGKRAPQFTASITNCIASNETLKKTDARSIMAASFVAAALDLPIDPNLGFAAIVPYRKRVKNDKTGYWEDTYLAQLQIQYKGFIQLAIRSGQYRKMNYAVVYKDELKFYNPITGEVTLVDDLTRCVQRAEGKIENIAGYYAWFQLHNGFTQEIYMSRQDVINHAKRYSQSYRYDLENGRQSSPWSTDFDAMAKKTVLKQLLSKWGILSIDMQKAIQDDQMVYQSDGNGGYADNEAIQEFAPQERTVDAIQIAQSPEQVALPTPSKPEPLSTPAPVQERPRVQSQPMTAPAPTPAPVRERPRVQSQPMWTPPQSPIQSGVMHQEEAPAPASIPTPRQVPPRQSPGSQQTPPQPQAAKPSPMAQPPEQIDQLGIDDSGFDDFDDFEKYYASMEKAPF